MRLAAVRTCNLPVWQTIGRPTRGNARLTGLGGRFGGQVGSRRGRRTSHASAA